MIIKYEGFELEFKDENVELYENVLLNELVDAIPMYLEQDLQKSIEDATVYDVKKAILTGMKEELSLYGYEIEEELETSEEELSRFRILQMMITNIEDEKKRMELYAEFDKKTKYGTLEVELEVSEEEEKILLKGYEEIVVESRIEINGGDIIQIENKYYRIGKIKELSGLENFCCAETVEKNQAIVRVIVGDTQLIYLPNAYGEDLDWIIEQETTIKGNVDVLKS